MGALYIRGVVMGSLHIRVWLWSTVHKKGVVKNPSNSKLHSEAAIITTVRTDSGSVAVCFI